MKIDRLLVPYCYSHNSAHQAAVLLLLLELFSIQAQVISQDLHFFGRNNFHESVKDYFKKLLLFRVSVVSATEELFELHRENSAISSNCFVLFSHVFLGKFPRCSVT